MLAPEFADYLRKRPCRIPGQVSRGFAFQVYPQFGRDGHCEVVYLVGKRIRKLRPAGGRPDDDDGTPVPRVRISESCIILSFGHKLARVLHNPPRSAGIVKARKNAVHIVSLRGEDEVDYPLADQ